MIDCLYGFMILVSSESDRFQEGKGHFKEGENLISEVDPMSPEETGQTEPMPEVGPKRGTSEITENLTSKGMHFTGSGVNWEPLVGAKDLIESLRREFSLFRKEKACAAREVLRERESTLYKDYKD